MPIPTSQSGFYIHLKPGDERMVGGLHHIDDKDFTICHTNQIFSGRF